MMDSWGKTSELDTHDKRQCIGKEWMQDRCFHTAIHLIKERIDKKFLIAPTDICHSMSHCAILPNNLTLLNYGQMIIYRTCCATSLYLQNIQSSSIRVIGEEYFLHPKANLASGYIHIHWPFPLNQHCGYDCCWCYTLMPRFHNFSPIVQRPQLNHITFLGGLSLCRLSSNVSWS